MNLLKKGVEGNNHQVLKVYTDGTIMRANCLPVFITGSQINIVDHVRSFLCKTLMHEGVKHTKNEKRGN